MTRSDWLRTVLLAPLAALFGWRKPETGIPVSVGKAVVPSTFVETDSPHLLSGYRVMIKNPETGEEHELKPMDAGNWDEIWEVGNDPTRVTNSKPLELQWQRTWPARKAVDIRPNDLVAHWREVFK